MPILTRSNLLAVPTFTPDAPGQSVVDAEYIRTENGVGLPDGTDLQTVLENFPDILQRFTTQALNGGLTSLQTAILRMLAENQAITSGNRLSQDDNITVAGSWNSDPTGQWSAYSEFAGGYLSLANGNSRQETNPVRTYGPARYTTTISEQKNTIVAWLALLTGTEYHDSLFGQQNTYDDAERRAVASLQVGADRSHDLIYFGRLDGSGHSQTFRLFCHRVTGGVGTAARHNQHIQVFADQRTGSRNFKVIASQPREIVSGTNWIQYEIPTDRNDGILVQVEHTHGDPVEHDLTEHTVTISGSTSNGDLTPISLGNAPNNSIITPSWTNNADGGSDGRLRLSVVNNGGASVALRVQVTKHVMVPDLSSATTENVDLMRVHTEDLKGGGITLGLELDNSGNNTQMRVATFGLVGGTQSSVVDLGFKLPDAWLSEIVYYRNWAQNARNIVVWNPVRHPHSRRVQALVTVDDTAIGEVKLRTLTQDHTFGVGTPNILPASVQRAINLPSGSTAGGLTILTTAQQTERHRDVLINDQDVSALAARVTQILRLPANVSISDYDYMVWIARMVHVAAGDGTVHGQAESTIEMADLTRRTTDFNVTMRIPVLWLPGVGSGVHDDGQGDRGFTQSLLIRPGNVINHGGGQGNGPGWQKYVAAHRSTDSGTSYKRTRVHWTLVGIRYGA